MHNGSPREGHHPAPPRRRRGAASRAWAAFLLALFVGGSLGAPLGDALFLHRAGPDTWRPHVEVAGAACHAERCILSHVAPAQWNAPRPDGAVQALTPSVAIAPWQPRADHTPAVAHAPGRPRAPPSRS